MEQLQNALLGMLQATLQQVPGVGGKNESGGDEFQKLLERAQNPQDVEQPEPAKKPQTPDKEEPAKAEDTQEKPAQQPEEPVKNQQAQDAAEQERMLMAAMQAMQAPVVENFESSEMPAEGELLTLTPVNLEVNEDATVVTLLENGEPEAMTMAEAGELLGETQVQPEAVAEEPVLVQNVPQGEVQTQEEAPVEEMVEAVQVETGAPQEESEDTADLDLSGEAQPLFRDVEAAPIKVGDAPAPESTRQPAPVGEQVAGALNQALAQGETKVELQLTPENLGKVTIELRFGQTGNLECILMAAEKKDTLELLSKNLPDMMRAFGQRYGEEVRVEIQQPQESQQEQQQRQYDGRNGHGGQPQDEEERHRRQPRSENPEDFLHQLRLGLIDTDEA